MRRLIGTGIVHYTTSNTVKLHPHQEYVWILLLPFSSVEYQIKTFVVKHPVRILLEYFSHIASTFGVYEEAVHWPGLFVLVRVTVVVNETPVKCVATY